MGENIHAAGQEALHEPFHEAWHAISVDDAVHRLGTNAQNGLDAAEAASRLRTFGPNRLPEGKKQGPLVRFLGQFNSVLV